MEKLDFDLLDFCLRNILPDRDVTVWSFFVKACMMLCKRSISVAEVNQSHKLLKTYCKQFELLYGANDCVPRCTSHYI